jgi:hypothetical protein
VLKPLSEDMSEIVNDLASNNEQIILLENARTALQSGDMEQGLEALKKLESEVFRPLLDSLKSKKLHSLSIIDSPGKIINISARGVNRWWRRRNVDIGI